MKKIIAIFLVMLMGISCLAACSSDKDGDVDSDQAASDSNATSDSGADGEQQTKPDPKTIKITSATEGVKVLGVRNLASETGLRMDWSCSGVEFAIDLKGDTVRLNFTVSAQCLFRVWVDGEEYTQGGEKYFTPINGILQLTEIPQGKHTLRVMKVTGYTLARAELIGVTFAGELLTDVVNTSDKELYIEFVGDSITCGWGTIGAHKGAYTDQDGTLAYSYLLAEELNADYSMTALSGQGLLYGTPGVTNGYLYADPTGHAEEKYDFSRKADIVVINVGTNDFTQEVGESNFKTAYLNFLKTVREKNGDRCKICAPCGT